MYLIYNIIKKMVFSLCLLYSFNIIVGKTGFLLPINYYTIALLMLFGIPGVIGLIILIKLV